MIPINKTNLRRVTLRLFAWTWIPCAEDSNSLGDSEVILFTEIRITIAEKTNIPKVPEIDQQWESRPTRPPLPPTRPASGHVGQLPASKAALKHPLKNIASLAMNASGNFRMIILNPDLSRHASAACMILPHRERKIRGQRFERRPPKWKYPADHRVNVAPSSAQFCLAAPYSFHTEESLLFCWSIYKITWIR